MNKRLVHLNKIIEKLVALRDNHRQERQIAQYCPIKVGDVCEPNVPQTFWKLALVKELVVSRDGQVRGAVVKTTTKGGSVSVLRRPLQHLFLLEIHQDYTPPDNSEPMTEVEISRPVRTAARIAQERIQIMNTHVGTLIHS